MEPGALGRRRRRGGAFSIARLFANGEAGGVYDPSDLTAEKVAWRRNLLTWSEDFTNAAWSASAVTVAANNVVAPDGTLTAETVTDTIANGDHYLENAATGIVYETGVTYTMSLRAKNVSLGYVFLGISKGVNTYAVAEFDIATGAVNRTAAVGAGWSVVSSSVSNLGSGWFLCTASIRIGVSAGEDREFFGLSNGIGAFDARGRPNYAGTLQSVALWGAQLERSPTATAYQRITDFTSDFLAAFPTHGLYQDAAGTTPVTALGQPVGLVIDSKTGGLANLGPDTATGAWVNTFSTAFDTFTSTSSDGFTATTTGAKTSIRVRVPATIAVGKTYIVSYTVTATNTTYPGANFSDSSYGGTGTIVAPITLSNGVRFQCVGTNSSASTTSVMLFFTTSAAATVTLSGFTVREVPGVHAIQPTNSSRPLLDGRVNLLTFSEQFDNAAWSKTATSVTANAAVAPDGTTTADRVTPAASTAYHAINQNAAMTVGASYLALHHFKQVTGGARYGYMLIGGNNKTAVFDLQTGAVSHTDAGISSASMTALGNGWFRCAMTLTATSGDGNIFAGPTTSATTGNAATLATDEILQWGADFRLAADAAYPYQRVAAATDYADVGVPRSFLFDGFDDSLYTASNMDLSGTDKVTVLAGVRKLSDAATGMLVELSAIVASNPGTFFLTAPSSNGLISYLFASSGTNVANAGSGIFAVAPDTAVATGIGNISGDICTLRRNAAVVQTTTTDQGTGNYGSYVLFIGRRNNASLPLNGKAYQLIVRGALTDAATLAQAERYVGAKTGLYL